MKKSDNRLQHAILEQLNCEPNLDPADIGITVNEGVVMLSGFVSTEQERLAAEAAAWRAPGVKAIAEEIRLRSGLEAETTDFDIAKRVVDAFAGLKLSDEGHIDVKVADGKVTLTGTVDWPRQADEAAREAGGVAGVCGVNNQIVIRSQPVVADLRNRIFAAFHRQADVDAASIQIEVDGGVVRLTGRMNAMTGRNTAARVIAATPGVTSVVNDIEVDL